MARFKLSLLGPPSLERDGVPLAFDTRKNVALAAYLALTGTHHSRETLVTLLWPELEPRRARAVLRRNLSVLIEVAARNHLLKLKGYHPARELAQLLGRRLRPDEDDDRDPRDSSLRRETDDVDAAIASIQRQLGLEPAHPRRASVIGAPDPGFDWHPYLHDTETTRAW